MKGRLRTTLVGAVAIATLVFANAAFAANTASISVWHTPMVLAGSESTTIHVSVPQATDGIAAVNIFVPSGYGATLNQPAGTGIGNVDATALAHDGGLTLPLSGPVTTDDPIKHTTDACSPGTNAAVWNLNLSVAGQTLVVPIYVNPTAGAATALGAYKLTICLPPWDVPVGTPGRAFEGAQLLDAKFTVNKIFTTPTAGGVLKWDTLFTPYTPGKGTPNAAATFEARAFVPVPISLGLHATYVKKTNTWKLSGAANEGGLPVGGLTIKVARGLTVAGVKVKSSVKTGAGGTWKLSGHLTPKKTTYFQVSATVGERDYTSTGCQSPLTPFAPAGCVSATLSPWSAKSVVVRIKR
jgi:predicted membrane protein